MQKIKNIANRIGADIKAYGPAGLVFLGYYLLVHFIRSAFCPMLALTGMPCAGCGLTRAFLYLFSGQLSRTVYIQPMAFAILAFLLYCGYFRYIKGSKIKGFTPLFVLLMVSMLIFYAVRMYLYFPGRVPYVYMKDNLLARRLPGYEVWVNRLILFLEELRA